jgi:hypothetical protein
MSDRDSDGVSTKLPFLWRVLEAMLIDTDDVRQWTKK